MILVSGLDLQGGIAELVTTSDGVDTIPERVLGAASGLGLRQLQLARLSGETVQVLDISTSDRERACSELARDLSRLWSASHATTSADASRALSTARPSGTFDARCMVKHVVHQVSSSITLYTATFRHDLKSLRALSAYPAFLLATHPAEENVLFQVRLAIYEIGANIIEHGQIMHPGAVIQLRLRLDPMEIAGFLQDQCAFFDPATRAGGTVLERLAARQRRGYGIPMLLQLLDRMEHEFNDVGNRITFCKRIGHDEPEE